MQKLVKCIAGSQNHLACGSFSCSMWDLVPDQGSNLRSLLWEHGVLVTGPQGSSSQDHFGKQICDFEKS